MTAWKVDRAWENVKNDSPELIAQFHSHRTILKNALRMALDRSSPRVNSCKTDPAEALEILNTQNTQDSNDPESKSHPGMIADYLGRGRGAEHQ
jgi:hypothetical protein